MNHNLKASFDYLKNKILLHNNQMNNKNHDSMPKTLLPIQNSYMQRSNSQSKRRNSASRIRFLNMNEGQQKKLEKKKLSEENTMKSSRDITQQ